MKGDAAPLTAAGVAVPMTRRFGAAADEELHRAGRPRSGTCRRHPSCLRTAHVGAKAETFDRRIGELRFGDLRGGAGACSHRHRRRSRRHRRKASRWRPATAPVSAIEACASGATECRCSRQSLHGWIGGWGSRSLQAPAARSSGKGSKESGRWWVREDCQTDECAAAAWGSFDAEVRCARSLWMIVHESMMRVHGGSHRQAHRDRGAEDVADRR